MTKPKNAKKAKVAKTKKMTIADLNATVVLTEQQKTMTVKSGRFTVPVPLSILADALSEIVEEGIQNTNEFRDHDHFELSQDATNFTLVKGDTPVLNSDNVEEPVYWLSFDIDDIDNPDA